MKRSGSLIQGIFFVTVALYPLLVFFGLKYVSPGILGLVLAIFLAFRLKILPVQEKTVLFPMLVILFSYALVASFLNSQRLLLIYPVLVNLFLAITFARSLRDGDSLLLRMVRARNINISEHVPRYLYNVTLIWVVFFIINGTIAAWTSTQSMEIWAIYNGLISYIAAGGLLAGEFAFRILYRRYTGITRSERE